MHPVLVFLIIVVAFLIWVLGSFIYVKLGGLIYRIGKEAVDEMNKGEIINESKENIEK